MLDYTMIDRELGPVLGLLTARGMDVDGGALRAELDRQRGELARIKERLNREVGSMVDVESPRRVRETVETLTGEPLPSGTLTRALAESPGAHPALRLITEARDRVRRVRGIEDLENHLYPPLGPDDGPKVHPEYHPHPSGNGMVVSAHPNLATIHRESRTFFREPGRVVVMADYPYLEVRVAAFLARDEALTRDLEASRGDSPRAFAEVIYRGQPDWGQVGEGAFVLARGAYLTLFCPDTDEARHSALAAILDPVTIPRSACDRVYDLWLDRYRDLSVYIAQRRHADPKSLFSYYGRPYSWAGVVKCPSATRNAFFPVASTVVDLFKLAVIEVEADERLRALGVVPVGLVGLSLILAAPLDVDRDLVTTILREGLEGVEPEMPLEARVRFGPSWGELS